jgi:hypothetical protein
MVGVGVGENVGAGVDEMVGETTIVGLPVADGVKVLYS